VEVDTAEIIDCGGSGANDYPFDFAIGGVNNRCSRLNRIRLVSEDPSGCPKFLRIAGDHRIAIDSFTEAQVPGTDADPIIELIGASATFHASSLRTMPAVKWAATSTRKTTLHFRDCILDLVVEESGIDPESVIVDADTEPDCFYSIERCDGQDNTPIPDLKSASSW
jgi:hypothetical protein